MLELIPPSFGRVLQDVRAGWDKMLFNCVTDTGAGAIQVASLAFADHAPLPQRYTADGPGDFPPLAWRGMPPSARATVLIVEDADSATPQPLILAAIGSIDSKVCGIDSGPIDCRTLGAQCRPILKWAPPDPPPGHRVHRYAFQIFSLSAGLPPTTIRRDKIVRAIREASIASGLVVGTYERSTSVLEPVAPALPPTILTA
jgi:phosphatidylethanolamine-binding protein (PEBP) family uncharacterized protein